MKEACAFLLGDSCMNIFRIYLFRLCQDNCAVFVCKEQAGNRIVSK